MRTYNPFRELEALRREVDRLFGAATHESWPTGRNAFLPGRSARTYPLINLKENPDEIVIEALAPGVNPDSFEITVLRDQFTLAGEKNRTPGEVEPEAWHRNERAAGKFVRSLRLPAEVDDTKVTAEYREGILRVTLPKTEAAKPKKITVNVA